MLPLTRHCIFVLVCAFVPASHAQQGILYPPNPYPDHYFFAPSGLRANAGARYLKNTSLVFFHSNKTKENGKSVGWGLIPTFLTGETTDIPIWLTAVKRWQTRNPNINTWAGGFFLKLPEDAESDGWIFHSGITFGNPEKNLSCGVLVGSFDKNSPPFKGIMLNGQVRLGRKSWLICENYLSPGAQTVTPVCLWGFRKKSRSMMLELGAGWTKLRQEDAESLSITTRYVPLPWFSLMFSRKK